MKALVTGGTGFVGKHLVRALVDKQVFVRMLVRKGSGLEGFKTSFVEFVYGDITDRDSLHGIADGIDTVFHLAATGHVSASSRAAYEHSFNVNVNGTKNLVEECLGNELKKFIHFSSTAAMGLINRPSVNESIQCQPSSPYQRSKYESEQVVKKYWRESRLPAVILRPCMIYGVGGTGEFLKICKLIKSGIFPRIGRGKNLTPIVHVKDVIEAAFLAVDNGKPGKIYLVASHKSFELNEIRKLVAKYQEVNKPYPYLPYWTAMLGAYCLETTARIFNFTPVVSSRNIASTVTDRVFDISRAERELGYIPKVNLEIGIKETIKWYKDMRYL